MPVGGTWRVGGGGGLPAGGGWLAKGCWTARGAPQVPQNAALGGFTALHFGQLTLFIAIHLAAAL
jgi:hypothetical protein